MMKRTIQVSDANYKWLFKRITTRRMDLIKKTQPISIISYDDIITELIQEYEGNRQ